VKDYFHEIIVSLDGANPEMHNSIRGLNSFGLILKGIEKAVNQKEGNREVSIRSVLQKQNFRELPDFIKMAKSLNVNRISFLAADVTSDAFGREHGNGAAIQNSAIVPDKNDTAEFRQIINKLADEYKDEFAKGFISESPAKLLKIAEYYEALNGLNKFPVTYCNAPMMSTVITSTGFVHPCYFLPAIGNIRNNSVKELINFSDAKETRRKVRSFEMERCKTCVCTLNINAKAALAGKF
jgi:MoaA/NifB/PqqE/SkfB family radical SAM enzyme